MIRHNPETVDRARELRKENLSFNEISKLLNIPSNTIRNWCYDLKINKHDSLRINNEFRRKLIKDTDLLIVPDSEKISTEEARLFAALLYGCEGCKYPAYNVVSFVNSNPALVKTFVTLLRKSFDIDETKIRVQLQLHTSHDLVEIKKYWSTLLNVPVNQFIKETITLPRGKMRRTNYLGTCTFRYLDNKLQLRLLGIFEKFCGIRN